jgi:F-box/leucine-rich repeat protein 14
MCNVAAGIRHLSGLSRLKVLSLWNCLRVTQQGLAHLQALPIVELSLRGCLIDDSACPALAKLLKLVKIDLRACERLTGKNSILSSHRYPITR